MHHKKHQAISRENVKFNLNLFQGFSPKILVFISKKKSILYTIEHLFARYYVIWPLLGVAARPMKEKWKIRPYFGVLPRVFNALKSAFSVPMIRRVDEWLQVNKDCVRKTNELILIGY